MYYKQPPLVSTAANYRRAWGVVRYLMISAGPNVHVRVGGVMVTPTSVKVRVAGSWVTPVTVRVRVAGAWVTL